MASITLTGTLLDPTGEVAVGDQIRFTHRTTTGETIQFARSVLIIPPNGLYNITLEFGLIFVEYLDIKDVNYKSLGVVTVNGDTTATDLPGLLNAIVPPTDAQLLLFQGILADTEDARDIALLAAAQQTTLELIASTTTHPNSTVLTLSGHTLPGDGGGGKWQLNGVVGQTASQSPTQLAGFLLNDGNGNQWALVDGVVLAFNGVQYLPLPFGATGNGNYAYNDNDFDKITDPDRLNPETLSIAIADDRIVLGDVLRVQDLDSDFEAVLASTVDIDSLYVVQLVGSPTLALVKARKGTIYMEGEGGGIGLQLMEQMNNSKRETFLLVQSDSTGDAQNEWVFLVAEFFAAEFPRYTVNYYLWNDGTGDYDAPVILESGRALTLYLYNGSKSGASSSYFNGNRKPNVYALREFDLIIRSYGHNNGAGSTLQEIINKEMESCIAVMTDQPQAEIVLTLQNVDTDLEAFSATQIKATNIVSQSLGLGIIDVRSAFSWKRITSDITEWMRPSDGVHPNDIGHAVWSRIVIDALTNPNKQNSRSNTPMLSAQQSPLPNSRFVAWDWNTGAPLNWTATSNVDATRITGPNETMDHVVRLTGNLGSIGFFNSEDLTDYLKQRPKGCGFYFMARVNVAPGNGTVNPGIVEVTTNLGTVTSNARSEPFGAFEWRIVYVDPSLLDGATSLLCSLYVGNNTDVIYLDRVAIIEGTIPREPTFNANEVFSEYYYDGNVAAKNTNVITVVGDSVTLDSTAEAFPSWLINVYGMIKGEQYTFEWSSTESVGSVLAREDLGDAGTVLATANPLSLNKLTWRPTKTSGSLQISTGDTLDPFTLSGLTIRKGS